MEVLLESLFTASDRNFFYKIKAILIFIYDFLFTIYNHLFTIYDYLFNINDYSAVYV